MSSTIDPNPKTHDANDNNNIQVQGSCLCRAIAFTLTGPPRNAVLCHCDNCAHASGVGFMANSFYNASQLHLPSSTPSLKTYTGSNTDSGATLQRRFCSDCGSPLFTSNSSFPELVAVTSGSLEREGGRRWRPKVELYCKDRRNWVGDVEGTRRFVEMF